MKKLRQLYLETYSNALTQQELQCGACKKTDNQPKIVKCSQCHNTWHIDCLVPALPSVPKGKWYCPPCIPLALRAAQQKKKSRSKKNTKKTVKHRPLFRVPSDEKSDKENRRTPPVEEEAKDGNQNAALEQKKKVSHGNPLDTISKYLYSVIH
jgi:hypothetical protein